jgi:hypothetical protein
MTMTMMCDNDNKELLIGLAYGELDESERDAVERHLASCAACREEAADLRWMRHHLAAWTPPERDLGFQIVRGTPVPAAAPTRPSRFRVSPAWGLAAAAVLVLAAASAIANLEVRYDANGLVVRTGWSRTTTSGDRAAPAVAADWRADFERVDRRLQELETGALTRENASSVPAPGPRLSDAEILRQVRQMLSQSEARQQRELILRIGQVMRDFDTTRRADFARFQQGLGQIQGMTTAEAAQSREMWNYLVRVANQK